MQGDTRNSTTKMLANDAHDLASVAQRRHATAVPRINCQRKGFRFRNQLGHRYQGRQTEVLRQVERHWAETPGGWNENAGRAIENIPEHLLTVPQAPSSFDGGKPGKFVGPIGQQTERMKAARSNV